MTQSGHLEIVRAEGEGLRRPAKEMATDTRNLSSGATDLARKVVWLPGEDAVRPLGERCRALSQEFKPLLAAIESPAAAKTASDDFSLLHENILLLESELQETCETLHAFQGYPQVRTASGAVTFRMVAVAEDYLSAAAYRWGSASFTEYMQAFQEITVLNMAEVWALIPVLKLVLLEQVAARGRRLLQDPVGSYEMQAPVLSLQEIKQTDWKDVIEPLIRFDHLLRQDPAGAYSRMDYETRDLYRRRIVHVADHSDCSEMEVAKEVLALARAGQKQSNTDP